MGALLMIMRLYGIGCKRGIFAEGRRTGLHGPFVFANAERLVVVDSVLGISRLLLLIFDRDLCMFLHVFRRLITRCYCIILQFRFIL